MTKYKFALNLVRSVSQVLLSLVHSIFLRLIHDSDANTVVEYVNRNDGQHLCFGHIGVGAGVDHAMGKDTARAREVTLPEGVQALP